MVSSWGSAFVQRHHYHHQGVQSQFLEGRHLQSFLVNKDFANIVPKVLRWLQVDFTPLQDPCLGYEQQDHIDPYCVEMASAAMIHFGLDPGKFVRFLSGKYTGQYWGVRLP
jgi:hypothetical protein